ncbi:hypothetical protein LCK86_004518, partial [Salmonella enterica subsp. enterica serovar Barranquilla]|nr:hypothetical protein [Salmonella enterica]EDZ2642453.1 hypothetical protein [Salmonella enterica subsp. enterica serovar Barranquilla]EID9428375.1 hypothetical protein [Salmonella enterica subsp. enterica serovar Barranquilla]
MKPYTMLYSETFELNTSSLFPKKNSTVKTFTTEPDDEDYLNTWTMHTRVIENQDEDYSLAPRSHDRKEEISIETKSSLDTFFTEFIE